MGNSKGNTSYLSTPKARAMMRNLAANVRALRQAQGWSMRELGNRSGIPWRVLENIENEVNVPSSVALAWLAEVFDITMNRLMFYPREALDGRAQDIRNGQFVVPGTEQQGRELFEWFNSEMPRIIHDALEGQNAAREGKNREPDAGART
jgi:transcriptional regulator with XRE-family HTH domain